MMKSFDLCLGFNVPSWKEVLSTPDSKLPKRIEYLSNNFDGEELTFTRNQISWKSRKGHNELMKMSTKYFLTVIMSIGLGSLRGQVANFASASVEKNNVYSQVTS